MASFAALLTPRGRGAVATISFRGDAGLIDQAGPFRSVSGRPLSTRAVNKVYFGRWGTDPAEEVVVCRVTREQVEVHCHGGEAAANRILGDLQRAGAERCAWHELIDQSDGPFEVEVARVLASATTPRAAAIIARQANGPLRQALADLAKAEIVADSRDSLTTIDAVLRWADFGFHLTHPRKVVLFGEPNVGKSSLINALVGFERAIVFDRPGTTRDVVTFETAFDGWPIRLSDTAGLRTDAEELETAGIIRARAELASADLRILVFDRSIPANPSRESEVLADVHPHLLVLSKSDLPCARGDVPLPITTVAVSARSGDGIDELKTQIVNSLVPALPAETDPVPISERQCEALKSARAALLAGDATVYRRQIGLTYR